MIIVTVLPKAVLWCLDVTPSGAIHSAPTRALATPRSCNLEGSQCRRLQATGGGPWSLSLVQAHRGGSQLWCWFASVCWPPARESRRVWDPDDLDQVLRPPSVFWFDQGTRGHLRVLVQASSSSCSMRPSAKKSSGWPMALGLRQVSICLGLLTQGLGSCSRIALHPITSFEEERTCAGCTSSRFRLYDVTKPVLFLKVALLGVVCTLLGEDFVCRS